MAEVSRPVAPHDGATPTERYRATTPRARSRFTNDEDATMMTMSTTCLHRAAGRLLAGLVALLVVAPGAAAQSAPPAPEVAPAPSATSTRTATPAPAPVAPPRNAVPRATTPAPAFGLALPVASHPQDPADSLYRAARSQMNTRRWRDAARTFETLRQRYPRSTYTGDSYYFEAMVRSRMDGAGVVRERELRRAVELLLEQRESHPDAGTARDGRELLLRLEAQLAERGDAEAGRSVVSAARAASGCDDEEGSFRATALSALLQMDPERARPLLMEVLREQDECSRELRERAVFILAQNPGEGTVEMLVELARTDPNPEIREVAVFWLSQTGREEAVDALVEILESGDATPEVQEKAVFALGQHPGERAAEAMRRFAAAPGGDPKVRANAIFWMGQRGGVEAQDFLRDLYAELDDPELKERILYSVAQSRGDAANVAWLTERAMDEAEAMEVRKQALFWAGQGGMEPGAVLRIYESAGDPEMREQAIFVLTQLPGATESGAAVDALMEIARTEEDPELRERAIFWLGQTDDPRVADFLLELIRGGGGGR